MIINSEKQKIDGKPKENTEKMIINSEKQKIDEDEMIIKNLSTNFLKN